MSEPKQARELCYQDAEGRLHDAELHDAILATGVDAGHEPGSHGQRLSIDETKLLSALRRQERRLVLAVVRQHPKLSVEQAIRDLREAGM